METLQQQMAAANITNILTQMSSWDAGLSFYLPLINFTSQSKYCLATIGEYHKSYQSMENKISEFFAIVSKAGRDTWEEVIKYLQVAEEQTWREKSSNEVTAQLFHWTKRTEKEKEKH